ncbi:hypothetical protein J6590_036677 [Homalodisca vitripennis]|nr:hypothetical protein J6590_036677 [Homalodisca vitripennis]
MEKCISNVKKGRSDNNPFLTQWIKYSKRSTRVFVSTACSRTLWRDVTAHQSYGAECCARIDVAQWHCQDDEGRVGVRNPRNAPECWTMTGRKVFNGRYNAMSRYVNVVVGKLPTVSGGSRHERHLTEAFHIGKRTVGPRRKLPEAFPTNLLRGLQWYQAGIVDPLSDSRVSFDEWLTGDRHTHSAALERVFQIYTLYLLNIVHLKPIVSGIM